VSPRPLAALIGALLLVVAGAGSAGRAGADAQQTIWLHYDYMVGADGTSYAPDAKGIDSSYWRSRSTGSISTSTR
jgi:hypothetical protein